MLGLVGGEIKWEVDEYVALLMAFGDVCVSAMPLESVLDATVEVGVDCCEYNFEHAWTRSEDRYARRAQAPILRSRMGALV